MEVLDESPMAPHQGRRHRLVARRQNGSSFLSTTAISLIIFWSPARARRGDLPTGVTLFAFDAKACGNHRHTAQDYGPDPQAHRIEVQRRQGQCG